VQRQVDELDGAQLELVCEEEVGAEVVDDRVEELL
jgi:hypothetical protein